MPHITDNRNDTEKKKAGVKPCAKEARARKDVKKHEQKNRLLLDEPAEQTTAAAAAPPEEFDFDAEFNGMDLAAGNNEAVLTPVITGAYTGPLQLHIAIADAPDGTSVAEYLLAVRDCLERETGVTRVNMA
jgi:hypothetical protein